MATIWQRINLRSGKKSTEMETRRKRGSGNLNQTMAVVKEEVEDGDLSEVEEEVGFDLEANEFASSSDEEDVVPRKRKKGKSTSSKKQPAAVVAPAVNIPSVNLKIMPMSLGKRVSLSVKEKMEIIQWIRNGESHSRIATRLKLPRATISNIYASREKIEKEASEGHWNKRRCRKQNLEGLDELVLSWVNYMRQQGTPVSGTRIREEARVLARGLGDEDFTASAGWLEKFKERNNVILPKARRHDRMLAEIEKKERLRDEANVGVDGSGDWDADTDFHNADDGFETVPVPSLTAGMKFIGPNKKRLSDWLSKIWPGISDGYSSQDVFFVDTFGLFYRASPENFRDFQGISCLDGEYARERLSVLLGVNATGTEKLKLCVIGGIVSPSSFGVGWSTDDQDKLPTEYWYNSTALVTPEIISSWLCKLNRKLEEASQRHVLLLMKNSPVMQQVQTLCSELTCIKVVLPEESVLKYIDSEVVEELKLGYKNLWLQKFIRQKKEKDENEKTVSVLDAISLLHMSWQQFEATMIANVFQKSGLLKKADSYTENVKTTRKTHLSGKRLMEEARAVGIQFPKGFKFKDLANLEENLTSTSMWADAIDDGNRRHDDDELPLASPPSANRLLNDLDLLRGWVVQNCSSDLGALHEAISTIQNFCASGVALSKQLNSKVPTGSLSIHVPSKFQHHSQYTSRNIFYNGTARQQHPPNHERNDTNTNMLSTVDLAAISISQGISVPPTSISNANQQQQQYYTQHQIVLAGSSTLGNVTLNTLSQVQPQHFFR